MKTKIIIFAAFLVFLAVAGFVWGGFRKTDKNKEEAAIVGDKVYVAVEEVGEIAVIDVATKKITARISLNENIGGITRGYMPHNVQVAPDNKSVWVTANAMDMSKKTASFLKVPVASADAGHGEETMNVNDQVIVIDPVTDKIIKRIELGTGLHLSHVALTPDSSYAVTAAQEVGMIYRINTKTYEVEKTVNANKSDQPHGLRISPDGKMAYIAMLGGKSIGALDIEDMSLSYIPLKGAAVQSGVTPDGRYALASVYDAKSLAVYDIAAKKLSYVDLPTEAKGPVQIYPSPDSKYVYVADQGYYFNQPKSDIVYKIDLSQMKVTQTIKAGEAPHGVTVSKDGKFAYVTNLLSGDLSVIDTAEGKEVGRVTVGRMPNGVSVFYGSDLIRANRQIDVSKTENKGNLVADHLTYDFGDIPMINGKIKHSFTLQNQGAGKVRISKIYTSCMCTEAVMMMGGSRKGPFGMPGHGGMSWTNQTVDAGEEITIEAEVDPAAHGPQGTGPAKKAIYIETDSSDKPIVLLMDINVTK